MASKNWVKQMKRVIFSLVLIILLFLTAGCQKSIDHGIVKEKQYSPSHKVYQPMIMNAGKKTRIIPRWITKSDSWKILVENDDGSDWWIVSEEYYNTVEVGDYVER